MSAPVTPRRGLRLPAAIGLAVASGVLLLLAFPSYGIWWLAPFGVAALAVAVRGRRLRAGAGLGLLAGIVFFGPLLAWTNMHVGYTPWILLTVFQASYLMLLGMALAWVSPLTSRRPWTWPLLIGVLWVAQEALRDRAPFGGFPWGRLAFSQGDSPALALASIGGAPLVTFAVALAGGLLAYGITIAWPASISAAPADPSDGAGDGVAAGAAGGGLGDIDGAGDHRAAGLAGGVGLPGGAGSGGGAGLPGGVGLAGGAGSGRGVGLPGDASLTGGAAGSSGAWPSGGAWRGAAGAVIGAAAVLAVGLVVPASTPDGRGVIVAVVQGNVPRLGLEFNAQRQEVLNNHVDATIELADRVRAGQAEQPDLVVWPENASDIDPLRVASAGAAIDAAARAINAPILVGAVLSGPGENESRNAGIVWVPGSGARDMYLKRHPVPFAEYLPMRPLIEPIARAITNQAKLLRTDFVSGTVPGVLEMGPARVGDVICFEVAYDDVVRDVVKSGATLLAVQTNNATFDESEARQQLAMVRLRAVEHGRDSLMASTVGISAFVTADGRVHDATEFNAADVVVRELRLGESTTLATRLGAAPEFALALLGVAALLWAAVTRRRSGL